MVRLRDIAQRVGVSVMTVSKALRGVPDVAPSTRERVRAVAAELGYVPDLAAQSLRRRASRMLGLIVPSSTNPVFARIVLAIEERTYEIGYELLYAHTLNLIQREEHSIRRMLARRVEGLFLYPVSRLQPEAHFYQELAAQGTPVVLLGLPGPFCQQFPYVTGDEEGGSCEATRHLLKLGHRRIAFLTGPLAAPWAHERLAGYRRALREAGIEPDDNLLFPGGSTIDDGAKAAEQLLADLRGVTAIQASSDLVAIGCGNVLLDRGVRIPHDLSLVGFGNILSAACYRVPLTTVRQPKRRLGNAAMDLMSRLLRGLSAEPLRLPATLSIRASTGPPPTTSP